MRIPTVTLQDQGRRLQPVSYMARKVNSTERGNTYSTYDLEALAVLNHADTVSVEDNSRKHSYSHSHANMTTNLQAWCRDNRSERVVA
jgi:hypothetical protein